MNLNKKLKKNKDVQLQTHGMAVEPFEPIGADRKIGIEQSK